MGVFSDNLNYLLICWFSLISIYFYQYLQIHCSTSSALLPFQFHPIHLTPVPKATATLHCSYTLYCTHSLYTALHQFLAGEIL